jgi:hypothetical protein
MQIEYVEKNAIEVAKLSSEEMLFSDVDSALDVMANVRYGTGCSRMVVGKKDINPEFFDLSTKIAGDVLQKFVTYQMRLAIVGDFSSGCSSSLRSFILESNKGREIYFTDEEEKAMNWLIS